MSEFGDHFPRIETGETRLGLPQHVEVRHHRLGHRVDDVVGHARDGDQRRLAAECENVGRGAVRRGGNDGVHVVRSLRHQLLDRRPADADQDEAAGGKLCRDKLRGVAEEHKIGVDPVVAQGIGRRVRPQLGGQRQVRALQPEGALDHLPGGPNARAGIADVDAFALEVVDAGDASIRPRHNCDQLRVEREHRAQIGKRPSVPTPPPCARLILDVGLNQGEIELAGLERVEIVDGARRRLDRAARPLRSHRLVHHGTQSAAHGVVDARQLPGAHRDKCGIG